MRILKPDHALLDRFAAIVGDTHALRLVADIAPYMVERRGLFKGESALVLKPGSTEEVSKIMALASQTGTPVVPVSGNTGLVGGQTPDADGSAIMLSLERMQTIRDIDPVANVIAVDAGCILQDVQAAAEKENRLFPLSLGSEGSCRIGGNLSTNAGGTAVLAYGNMRHLCLGVEVVLPTGEIWDGMRRLKKDNTGYDLRDLFIGAEGTLGVITGAVLKLFPRPLGHAVALTGLTSVEKALELFDKASAVCGTALTGFELIARIGMKFTVKHTPGARHPLESAHEWYVLIDISTSDSEESADRMLQTLLEDAFEAGIVDDAAIASSQQQAKELWHMREAMSDAQRPEGGSIKHDVSVPVSHVPAFIAEANAAVEAMIPGVRVCAFGHMGDGNIHYNVSQPVGADKEEYLARWKDINEIVHAIVLKHGGSISAEHGIGQLKRDELASIRSDIEIDLMRRIKASFDPKGIMNPGKVITV